ncbi:MAG TPA: hypothetical protein VHT28_16695 [Silvibacterium sp.]|nr:hypothetical protein [Silvibacterium sp.]
MRFFKAAPCAAAMLLALAGLPALHAQAAPSQPRPPALPGTERAHPDEEEDTITHQMSVQAAIKRNKVRQQHIVDDTAKLLELAHQLKDDVNKNAKDTSSAAVAKRAEEIEKLAKDVKEKMRDTN